MKVPSNSSNSIRYSHITHKSNVQWILDLILTRSLLGLKSCAIHVNLVPRWSRVSPLFTILHYMFWGLVVAFWNSSSNILALCRITAADCLILPCQTEFRLNQMLYAIVKTNSNISLPTFWTNWKCHKRSIKSQNCTPWLSTYPKNNKKKANMKRQLHTSGTVIKWM